MLKARLRRDAPWWGGIHVKGRCPAPGGVLLRRKPPEPGQLRVVRGGSSCRRRASSATNNNPRNLRAAYRNRNEPDNRNNNLGFRVARVFP